MHECPLRLLSIKWKPAQIKFVGSSPKIEIWIIRRTHRNIWGVPKSGGAHWAHAGTKCPFQADSRCLLTRVSDTLPAIPRICQWKLTSQSKEDMEKNFWAKFEAYNTRWASQKTELFYLLEVKAELYKLFETEVYTLNGILLTIYILQISAALYKSRSNIIL